MPTYIREAELTYRRCKALYDATILQATSRRARRIARSRGASTMLGLRMLDHLMVSDERHYSFLDASELGPRP